MLNSKKKNKDISFIFCVFNEYPSLNNNIEKTIKFISKKNIPKKLLLLIIIQLMDLENLLNH